MPVPNLRGCSHCIHLARLAPHHSICRQLAPAAPVRGPPGLRATAATARGTKGDGTSPSDIASSWIAPLLHATLWSCGRSGDARAMSLLVAPAGGVHGRRATASTNTAMVCPLACAFRSVTASRWKTQHRAAQFSGCEMFVHASALLCCFRAGWPQRQRSRPHQLHSLDQPLHQ